MQTIRVWDLPLRLFHWLLAAAVAAAVITGQIGGNLMIWHGRLVCKARKPLCKGCVCVDLCPYKDKNFE